MADPTSGAAAQALAALAAPVAKLIETCSAGMGRLYEPVHIRRVAQAEASRMIVLAEAGNQVAELQRRATERFLAVEQRRQENIESIAQKAETELPPQVGGTPVRADWAARFFDECKDVSDMDMQALWARLLAGEVARPGAFSLRALRVLSALSVEEARIFGNLCSLSFHGSILTPFVFDERQKFLNGLGLSYSAQKQLEAAGLIHREGLGLSVPKYKGALYLFPRGEGPAIMALRVNIPDAELPIELGVIDFTSEGAELSNLWKGELNREHSDWVLQRLRDKGWRADYVERTPTEHGHTFTSPSYITDYFRAKAEAEAVNRKNESD